MTSRWEQFYLQWLKEGRNIMVIIYENLTGNLFRTHMNDMLTFLNFTANSNRIDCTMKYSEGRFHRKEKCVTNKLMKHQHKMHSIPCSRDSKIANNIFTKDHRREINAVIDGVNRALVKRGFKPLPSNEYKNTKIKLKVCP